MNALGIPGVINNFNLYNDGTVLVGLTGEISLPDFEGMTETLSGPGILGEIEEVIIGQFGSMELEIPFRILDEDAFKLMSPATSLNLTLRASEQFTVKSTGGIDYKGMRVVVRGRMKKLTSGTVKQGGAMDAAVTVEVVYIMIELDGKIYKQEYMLGNDRVVKFSMRERDGFEPVGFKDPSNNVLEGVWIPMFYGSILGADTSTPKMVSLAGLQPCYNNTTDKEHTAIANFSSRAAFLGGGIVQTITDLLIMFAKSTNSQEAYGYGNSSGYDASLAPTNGVKQNAVVGGGQFYGTKDAKSLNKIFHSIVLGTYQQWMRDPYTLLVNGRYKVSKNYTYDVTGAKYQDTGISLPKMFESDGSAQKYGIFYPHKYQTVPGFGAVPVHPCKGSTSTGGCDGLWQNVEIVAVALRFGRCDNGTVAGLRCLTVVYTAGHANGGFGAAVLLLPPVGVAA